jgi:hypothetical protein
MAHQTGICKSALYRNMKTDRPFLKSFACGGVLFVALAAWLVAKGTDNLSYRMGYTMSACLVPAIITGTWGWLSKKEWSWGRFILTFLLMCIVTAVLQNAGKAPK